MNMNDLKPIKLTETPLRLLEETPSRTSVSIAMLLGTLVFMALTLSPMTANADINSPLKAEDTELTIGIIGDSLSAGYGLKQHESWAHLLSKKLETSHPRVNVINASVSGATTDAGLQMQAGLLQQQPDILILELGANDGLQGKPLSLIKKNLSTLITQAQKSGAEVLLVGIKLPPNLGRRYIEPFFAQFEDLAAQHQTALVPFLLEGVAGNPALMQADGLHPNSAAQSAILEIIWQPLEGLLKQKQQER